MSRLRDRPVRARIAPTGTIRRFLCLAALVAAVHPAGALWGEFARGSDRSDDPVILEVLDGASLDERLEIMSALAERPDPFIGAYLGDFLLRHTPAASVSEHLMRVLLESTFPLSMELQLLEERVAPNREALLDVSARLATFRDPQLCAAIVRLIPLLGGGLPDLLGLVGRLTERLKQGYGYLDPRDDGLLLDALEAMGRTGSPDFLEPALAVARLSREKLVVERARAVARALALGETGR